MPVAAQSIQDQVVTQLSNQGFAQVEMNRTLLGRLRFVAESDRYRRELVIHPSTGAVLFDRLTDLEGDDGPVVRLDGDEAFEEELEEDDFEDEGEDEAEDEDEGEDEDDELDEDEDDEGEDDEEEEDEDEDDEDHDDDGDDGDED
ncbi:MAG: hypothetical protein AAFP28_07775 [Pseudomonadota bacterium]